MSRVSCVQVLLIMSFCLPAIAAGGQPGWVTTKQDIRYPDQLYILGVGVASVGDDRSEAIKKSGNEAFADIAKQLRANISDVSATRTIEVAYEKGGSGVSSEMRADLQVSTDLNLGGLKIVDSYYDKSNRIFYSLAVLDRQLVGSEFKEKLVAYHDDFERFLAQLSRERHSGSPVAIASALSGAYKSSGRYNSILPVYNYISAPLLETDSSWNMPGTLATAYLDQTANELIRSISISKTSGEDQLVNLNVHLKPLVVRVEYKDSSGIEHPAEGFKIDFMFVNGIGKTSSESTTNDSGIAECQVYSLTPYASTFYQIRAQVDFSAYYCGTAKEPSPWDKFLESNAISASFSLVKSKLTLDDRLRQLVMDLTRSLNQAGQTVCVSRIDYQGKIPGELSEYLRQHVESALRQNSELRLVMPPIVGKGNGTMRDAGEAGPLMSSAAKSGIRFVIAGSYWQKSDGTELDLNAIDPSSDVIAASSSITIAGNILPNASLVPDNYDSTRDDPIIANQKSGDDLKVNLWVNRPDGVYHDGDTLSILLSVNKEAYVELVYVDASGRSLMIFPNTYEWNNRLSADRIYEIPDAGSVGVLRVEPPFGREIIKAYASETPFPIPTGTKFRGLVVLNSIQDFQSAARGIGLVSKGYRESSVVISTFAALKQNKSK